MNAADYLRSHRCHDVPFLVKRWHAVARVARLDIRTIYVSGDYPVLFIHTPVAAGPRLYLSAGVHGDEAAPVSALLEWAADNTALLTTLPVAIFPLFNPSGLTLNTRADHKGIDLNRRFHDACHPHIKAWWNAIGDMRFSHGLCMHEDYDAQGIYCYELSRSARLDCAERMIEACEAHIPRDPRVSIDGRAVRQGFLRRRKPPDLPGMPEAVALYMHSTDHTMTFETPSEHSLADRIGAHRAFIDAFVRGVQGAA
jgi:murein peptide amidase A